MSSPTRGKRPREDEEGEQDRSREGASTGEEGAPRATIATAPSSSSGSVGKDAAGTASPPAGSDGSSTGSGGGGKQQQGGGPSSSRYRYAVVCSSNVNRSMEAHVALFNNRLRVGSFGAGRFVRLPFPGGAEGRAFEFGTPYEEMLAALSAAAKPDDSRAADFFRKTKILDILRRNKQIKRAPERWQDLEAEAVAGFDVVVCFEQRIYDAVVEDLLGREPRDLEPICVICMETKDDPKEAIIAGRTTVKLAQELEQCDDLASEAPEVCERFMEAEGRRLLFQIHYL